MLWLQNEIAFVREDTHKKVFFFSGRTTKVWVPSPPHPLELSVFFTILSFDNGLKWIENGLKNCSQI